MLIGIIGAPNKGKSTLFSALTMNDVAIADYPFTTIDPNVGIAYVTKTCVEKQLNTKCNARNSLCVNGVRMLPINLMDVAGLVEGAHSGKGMGNQFLNDLSSADAFMLVVDASGKTDRQGNHSQQSNPVDDVKIIIDELSQWLFGIIRKHMHTITRAKNGLDAMQDVLTGLKVKRSDIEHAISKCNLPSSQINWRDSEILAFCTALIAEAKPIAIIANKSDSEESVANIKLLKEKFGSSVFECSGAMELALRKAGSTKVINYLPGQTQFRILKEDINPNQKNALAYMQKFIGSHENGTGVQNALNSLVFKILGNIVVYPVEDENKYSDHFGNVLPDSILLKNGSKCIDLAECIHTELAKNMLYAIDAIRKMRIGKEHILKDNDVIKIVSAAR